MRDFANMALRPLPAVRAGQEDSAILGQLRSRSANQLAYYQTQMVRGSCSHVKKAMLVFSSFTLTFEFIVLVCDVQLNGIFKFK